MNQKFVIGAAMVIVGDFTITGCVEPYAPPVISADAHVLVVDGFLNSKDGMASIKLTRTLPVYSKNSPPVELNALVRINDEHGAEYVLTEKGNGLYEKTGINVDESKRYRLSIETAEKEVYSSEYVPVKNSPKIDSLFWLASDDGVRVYVNTSDPTNSTHYYRWECTETYEYHSAFGSSYKLAGGVVIPRPLTELIYQCWRTIPPTQIQIGSSVAADKDVIDNFELQYIERSSIKISQRYSVLVRQYAITEEAYNYWRELEASTEKLGGLFDPMPSEVTGNIASASSHGKVALGYFSIGSYQEKRIFIDWRELPDYLLDYNPHCQVDSIPLGLIGNLPGNTLLIDSYGSPIIQGYLTSESRCIDCRFLGGTLTKPAFWR